MKSSNDQRNRFTVENTSTCGTKASGKRRTGLRPFLALGCLIAATVAASAVQPAGFDSSLAADQSMSVGGGHRADIIDDILDILDDLLGGGGKGTGTGSGTGGTGGNP